MAHSTTTSTTALEIERRFHLHGKPENLPGESLFIQQAYIGEGTRVRITTFGDESVHCEVTRKTGRGLVRTEENFPVSEDAARTLYGSSDLGIEKRRYIKDGWEVDVFEGDLRGLVLAEFEMKSEDQEVPVPDWLTPFVDKEVTNSMSNYKLALLARERRLLEHGTSVHEDLKRQANKPPRIVLTGAPCSGKSAGLKHLQKRFPGQLYPVPEAATLVFHDLGINRPPNGDCAANDRFQRHLASVQIALEDIADAEVFDHGKQAIICDRGIRDAAAYLEGGLKSLSRILKSIGLTDAIKLSEDRYDLVIVMGAAPEDVYEANRANNPARVETYAEMRDLHFAIREAWEGHPGRVIVNGKTWEEKMDNLERVVQSFLERTSSRAQFSA